MINDIEDLFMGVLGLCMSSSEKIYVFRSSAYFFFFIEFGGCLFF